VAHWNCANRRPHSSLLARHRLTPLVFPNPASTSKLRSVHTLSGILDAPRRNAPFVPDRAAGFIVSTFC